MRKYIYKKNETSTKKETEISTSLLPTHVIFLRLSKGESTGFKIIFNLSWLRVRMSYHRFNNLAELINGDLAAKIGQGIFSKDLMDR